MTHFIDIWFFIKWLKQCERLVFKSLTRESHWNGGSLYVRQGEGVGLVGEGRFGGGGVVPLFLCIILLVAVADLGGRRGRAPSPPPPGHPNSFDFMQFSGKFGKIVCWCSPWGVGDPPPPPGKSWIRRGVGVIFHRQKASFKWILKGRLNGKGVELLLVFDRKRMLKGDFTPKRNLVEVCENIMHYLDKYNAITWKNVMKTARLRSIHTEWRRKRKNLWCLNFYGFCGYSLIFWAFAFARYEWALTFLCRSSSRCVISLCNFLPRYLEQDTWQNPFSLNKN